MSISDEKVLRHSIGQVIVIDLTMQHGAEEGTGWYIPGTYKLDPKAGENLVQRGVLRRDGDRLFLTESSLMRILHVALEASVKDLLVNDPPSSNLPEISEYLQEEDNAYLTIVSDKPAIRGW